MEEGVTVPCPGPPENLAWVFLLFSALQAKGLYQARRHHAGLDLQALGPSVSTSRSVAAS